MMTADLILYSGRIHTVNRTNPQTSAVAIAGGRFLAVGDDQEIMTRHVNRVCRESQLT